MISMTSKTGSTDGVIFDESPKSTLENRAPRVSKAKTLDLNVSIDFRGYVKGDWEKRIVARLDEDQEAALRDLIENETYINLIDKTGYFDGVVSDYSINNGELQLDFWVRS